MATITKRKRKTTRRRAVASTARTGNPRTTIGVSLGRIAKLRKWANSQKYPVRGGLTMAFTDAIDLFIKSKRL